MRGIPIAVLATNHKDIGTAVHAVQPDDVLHGWRAGLAARAELFKPRLQWVNTHMFNQLATMHGIIMVFGANMPVVGFANWMLPLQIGAGDMAFARMNNFSFWLTG